MGPKTFTAPKVWRRPYTSIYNDNYRFGNSLYSGAVDDIERKYADSMARTTFRADRPDLGFTSFAGSNLTGSPPPSSDPGVRRAMQAMESEMSSAEMARSLSATRLAERTAINTFNSYHSGRELASLEAELEESRARRRRRRPESAYFADEAGLNISSSRVEGSAEAHSQTMTMERCREMQSEIDRLNNTLIDTETRIKTEAAGVKNKLNMEVSDLIMALDEQDRINQELSKAIKKQQRQVQEIQAGYEGTQRSYAEAIDILTAVQMKASQLCHEVDAIRSNVDQTSIFKTTSTRTRVII